MVARKRVDAPTAADVPDLDRVVERAGDDALALRVKVQTHDLRRVPKERVELLSGLDVPELRSVVHRARGNDRALRIERQTHDFGRVAAVRVVELPSLGAPELARLVERPRDDLVATSSRRVCEGRRRRSQASNESSVHWPLRQ